MEANTGDYVGSVIAVIVILSLLKRMGILIIREGGLN